MSFNTTRPSYQTAALAPVVAPVTTTSTTFTQPLNSGISTLPLQQQSTFLPASNLSSAPIYSSGLPLSSGQQFSTLPVQQLPLAGQQQFSTLPGQQLPLGMAPLPGQQLPLNGQAGANNLTLPNPEIELQKRMLDKHRDLKMKEAEMETNKEKKLEEKADKQREKAVKWISRGVMPNMATRHEAKADKLEQQAHEHHMKAESYKLEAKVLENQRKAYDPPKEEKKTPAKPGASGSKQAASKTTEVKKDAAGDIKKTETTTATTNNAQNNTTSNNAQNNNFVAQEKKVEQTTERPVSQTGSSTA